MRAWGLAERWGGARGATVACAMLLGAICGPAAARADTWSPAGTMATARYAHTATLLPGGEVILTGGTINGSASLTNVDRYHPATNTWSPVAPMAVARFTHTATLLTNGKILVAGGWTGGSDTSTSALYDPASNTWTPTGNMAVARERHTATLLGNGKVLVTGGASGASVTATAQLYDPAIGAWSPAPNMDTPRASHTATLLANGKVLVAGGYTTTTTSAVTGSAQIYDPVSNTWSPASNLSTSRGGQTATLLASGRVLVAGGTVGGTPATASAERYDPASNTWSPAGTMATARAGHAAARLANGKVLAAGGYTGTAGTANADLYDPVSNTWSAAASMSTARRIQTATLLASGKILVPGGFTESAGVASAELYTPTIITPPVNAVAPRITGTAAVGHLLSCSPGTWGGTAPIGYAYRWLRGATTLGAGATYKPVLGDAAKQLLCRVTASNSAGSRTADSAPVKPTIGKVKSQVTHSFLAFAGYTLLTKLRVTGVPSGGKVTVRCSGRTRRAAKACPFKRKTFSGRTVNLTKRFRHRKLLSGTKVDIRITAAALVGKRRVYVFRNHKKAPKITTGCLSPSTGKPARC